MATDYDLWQALQAQMVQATQGIAPRPQCVIEWPSTQLLSDVTHSNQPVVAVIDTDMTTPTTRWKTIRGPVVVSDCFTSSSVNIPTLAPGQKGIITITPNNAFSPAPNAPNYKDAVSCAINYGLVARGVVAIAGFQSSFYELANELANAINTGTDPAFAGILSAQPVANFVEVTNISSMPLSWYSAAGNNGQQVVELARENRVIQIASWTPDLDSRRAVAEAIKEQCGQLQLNFGVLFADGTAARVELNRNRYFADYHMNDLWRFDQYIDCEQGVTNMDLLYSVLCFQWTKSAS